MTFSVESFSLLLKGIPNWNQNGEGYWGRGFGNLDSNPVQLVQLYEKDVQNKQHWDPEISTYLTNRLEQISMLIAESGEFTFQIYF